MKKVAVGKAVNAYRMMTGQNFTLAKMTGKAKFAVVRALGKLKLVAADYDAFLEEASKRLRPEGYEEIAKKIQGGGSLTEADREIDRKYGAELTECLTPELERELEVAFAPLTEEELSAVLDSNPELPLAAIGLLVDVLGAAPEEGAGDAV